MRSAAISPIMMQVRFVLAWTSVGMIEASAIQRLSTRFLNRVGVDLAGQEGHCHHRRC
jgi:hypothetical protein